MVHERYCKKTDKHINMLKRERVDMQSEKTFDCMGTKTRPPPAAPLGGREGKRDNYRGKQRQIKRQGQKEAAGKAGQGGGEKSKA